LHRHIAVKAIFYLNIPKLKYFQKKNNLSVLLSFHERKYSKQKNLFPFNEFFLVHFDVLEKYFPEKFFLFFLNFQLFLLSYFNKNTEE
jgi:hypothetical protein